MREPNHLFRRRVRVFLQAIPVAIALLCSLGLFSVTYASSAGLEEFTNLDSFAKALQIDLYPDRHSVRPVKIAILDNGFRGYADELGRTLPVSTKFHPGPVAVDPNTEDAHGLFMAQMVAGLLSRAPNIQYELHLFSSFGYSNLEKAVETISNEKFDIALYAQVWEYGGNGDGRGFINRLVSRATQAGVTWINATGNYKDATYQGPVERTEDDWAWLPGRNQSVQVRCLENPKGKCPLRIVLSWNDFKDDVRLGTDKDLDLVLTDDALRIIETSGLKQRNEGAPNEPGTSLYPREIIQTEVKPGLYFIRVKIRSQNFDRQTDRLRIVTKGDFTTQIDTTHEETLLPPADHSDVIAVGASDSEKSSDSKSMNKPDLLFPSLITLENGEQYKGSSNSSAAAAAAAVALKALQPELSKDALLELLSGASSSHQGPGAGIGGTPEGPAGSGLPLEVLQFQPTGQGCFVTTILPYIPRPASVLLVNGGFSVMTSQGPKIFTHSDPFQMVAGMRRTNLNDVLAVGDNGYFVVPRARQGELGERAFEVVQLPRGQYVCGFGMPGATQPAPVPAPYPRRSGATLRLPHPNQL